ncbi:alpha/beta hydrolase [Tomitella biformata]|uniref:alpha/beta hydrolase n=1 Tax=Tomitella biformata TaxID=630403 RepID=UPI000464B335|nr:alpha/beta hydrolase [Tomitella biformata]
MLDISSRPDAGALAVAARNAWALSPFGEGIEAPSPLPSTVVYSAAHCTVRLYHGPADASLNPVLLVPPLAVPISCYDLRAGQSLAAHLVASGRPTYVVDYGRIRYADRGMGFEDWFADIVPTALRQASAHAGGAQLDIIAWSLGGTISLLTAAANTGLPLRSITTLGTPIDYRHNPSTTPLRLVGKLVPPAVMSSALWAVGGIPSPLVKVSYRSTALQRELTRPWFITRNLANSESLAQMEAIDRFMSAMPGYPARLYTQMHQRLILRNDLMRGVLRFGEHRVNLADVDVPVLAFGGASDVLAPLDCVAPIADVLTGAPSVRVEVVPGSHLGMVSGNQAEEHTWPVIDEFHSELCVPV